LSILHSIPTHGLSFLKTIPIAHLYLLFYTSSNMELLLVSLENNAHKHVPT
jgi:hypothetical protein